VYNDNPNNDAFYRERLACAMTLGKPIRLLVMPGSRVPADLCAGYADVQRAPVASVYLNSIQVRQWLAEVENRPAPEAAS
jgi:hypothetical protein